MNKSVIDFFEGEILKSAGNVKTWAHVIVKAAAYPPKHLETAPKGHV